MAKVQASEDAVFHAFRGGTAGYGVARLRVSQIQQVDFLFAFLPCLLFWAKGLRKTTMIMT